MVWVIIHNGNDNSIVLLLVTTIRLTIPIITTIPTTIPIPTTLSITTAKLAILKIILTVIRMRKVKQKEQE